MFWRRLTLLIKSIDDTKQTSAPACWNELHADLMQMVLLLDAFSTFSDALPCMSHPSSSCAAPCVSASPALLSLPLLLLLLLTLSPPPSALPALLIPSVSTTRLLRGRVVPSPLVLVMFCTAVRVAHALTPLAWSPWRTTTTWTWSWLSRRGACCCALPAAPIPASRHLLV